MNARLIGFRGRRGAWHTHVDVLEEQAVRELPLHLEVYNHSPTGFEWGYEGSGPAQLALAMCVELVGAVRALRVHQDVKRLIVANLVGPAWLLRDRTVLLAVKASEFPGRQK